MLVKLKTQNVLQKSYVSYNDTLKIYVKVDPVKLVILIDFI